MLLQPRKAHQDGDIEWIRSVHRGLLANEPGLGKSRSTIDAFADFEKVLVVAPTLIIESGNWQDEIDAWGGASDTEFTLAPYTKLNARNGSKVLHKVRPEYLQDWDAVVLDECHYIKGRATKWTWAAQQICKNIEYVIPMTGTPIPNWAHEVFTLLQMIYPQEADRGQRFGSFWRWAGDWFDTSPTRFSNGNPVVGELLDCRPECYKRDPSDPCKHYVRFTSDNFGSHWRRCLRRDCLDLPPSTEQIVRIPMTTAQRRIYQQMKKDFSTTVSGGEVLAWSQGKKNVMLDQITVSPWFLNQEGEPRGGKLEMLRFDLQSRSRPTLVVAHYRAVVEACARVAENVGARTGYIHGGNKGDAGQVVRDFKSGKLDVLVGSVELVAEGLNLTQADMCIFVEKSFKPYRNEQARYRIDRMGQRHPTTIRDYVTPDTVDVRKRERIATKEDRQQRIMTAAEFTAML